MKSYVINIDKLQIQINENTNLNTEIKHPYSIATQHKTKFSKDYQHSYIITYRNNPICYLYHINYLNKNISKLYFFNPLLYQTDYTTIITNLLTQLKAKDYSVSKLEIAINTNINLLNKFYNKLLANQITFKSQSKYAYKPYSFIPSENRFSDNILADTIYIRKNSKEYKDNYCRIENKTNEIYTSSNKHYILKSYRNRLDTDKDIYRLELCLDFIHLTNRSRNIHYKQLNFDSDPITAYKYKQLIKDEIVKENWFKPITLQKNYNIDISQLENESYLLSLFDYFTPFNYSSIVKVKTPTTLTFTYIEKKTDNNIYDNEVYDIEYKDIFSDF